METDLDTVRNLLVVRVGRIVLVGHAPFVHTKLAPGLENLEDLAIDAFESGGVDGRFNGVDYHISMVVCNVRSPAAAKQRSTCASYLITLRPTPLHILNTDRVSHAPRTTQTSTRTGIKAILPKLLRQLHKVPFNKVDLVAQPRLASLLVGALDLEIIIVETGNVGIGKTGNFAGGATDTASDVQDAHAGFDFGHVRQEVFVAGKLYY